MTHVLRDATTRLERAQDLVEYALLILLISLVATAAVIQLGSSAERSYADAASCIADPNQAGSQGAGGGQGLPGGGKGQGKDNPCPKP